MRNEEIIRELRLKPASSQEQRTGLLGWLSGRLGPHLKVDGIAIRRTLDGHLRLSFPERRDSAGRSHPYLKPVDDETRRLIEREVFRRLGLLGRDAAP